MKEVSLINKRQRLVNTCMTQQLGWASRLAGSKVAGMPRDGALVVQGHGFAAVAAAVKASQGAIAAIQPHRVIVLTIATEAQSE